MASPGNIEQARIALMERVFARLGLKNSPTDLLKRMGWSAERPNSTRTISNWIAGRNGPAFDDAMDMLDEIGFLQPEAVALWRGISLAEAKRVVAEVRANADRVLAQRLADGEEHPQDTPLSETGS